MTFSVAILTTSDRASQGIYEDKSGKILVELFEQFGFDVVAYDIVADDYDLIKEKLDSYSFNKISLIITSGGTGFSKRDVTVDATIDSIDKLTPGIAEAMRNEGAKITPLAYLSRAAAGIKDESLIINFPGSPKACKENFDIIKPFIIHALQTISGIDNHNI